MAIRDMPRMTDDERDTVRRLADVYRQMEEQAQGSRSPDDHTSLAYLEDNVSQDLPWREDWDRADHLQRVADRYGVLLHAKGGRRA